MVTANLLSLTVPSCTALPTVKLDAATRVTPLYWATHIKSADTRQDTVWYGGGLLLSLL